MSSSTALIDASNLHQGGGVQVAASFLDEIVRLVRDKDSRLPEWVPDGLTVEASSRVIENMMENPTALRVQRKDRVWRHWRHWVPSKPVFDVSFTIFGPEYGARRARRTIVGFADVTSLFPPPRELGPPTLRRRVRRRVSRAMFRRSDGIVVEAEHVRVELAAVWHFPPEKIKVIPNTYNSVFRGESAPSGEAVRAGGFSDGVLRLCYVTRPYPHKNLDILPEVVRLLRDRFDIAARVLVTLSEDEWEARPHLHPVCDNLGVVRVAQLPSVYEQADMAIFPSLLECFSATPLEAMAMGTPLVASDRPFVNEVCGDVAGYFEPNDPNSVAAAVAEALNDPGLRATRVIRGLQKARSWPTAQDRAVSYLALADAAITRG